MSASEGYDFYVAGRYHGVDDPVYQTAAKRNGVAQVQGRGRCTECGHQTFFSQRDRLLSPDISSVPMLCAQCALAIAGAPARMLRQLRDELSRCPAKDCAYQDQGGPLRDIGPA